VNGKKSRKRAHPAPLKNIYFNRPRKDDSISKVDGPFEGTLMDTLVLAQLNFVLESNSKC